MGVKSWSDQFEDADVVIGRMDAVVVYLNQAWDLVIRQQQPMGEDDHMIIIPVSQVAALIDGIRRAVNTGVEG